MICLWTQRGESSCYLLLLPARLLNIPITKQGPTRVTPTSIVCLKGSSCFVWFSFTTFARCVFVPLKPYNETNSMRYKSILSGILGYKCILYSFGPGECVFVQVVDVVSPLNVTCEALHPFQAWELSVMHLSRVLTQVLCALSWPGIGPCWLTSLGLVT